jgi:hypothetical protein
MTASGRRTKRRHRLHSAQRAAVTQRAADIDNARTESGHVFTSDPDGALTY